MKRIVMVAVACLLLIPGFAAAKDQTFSGEIMDSQCAMNGSHEMMVKKEGIQDKRLIPGEASQPPSSSAEGMVEFTVGGSDE